MCPTSGTGALAGLAGVLKLNIVGGKHFYELESTRRCRTAPSTLRDEPWGDRHFVVVDPNGIGVDVVQRLHAESKA